MNSARVSEYTSKSRGRKGEGRRVEKRGGKKEEEVRGEVERGGRGEEREKRRKEWGIVPWCLPGVESISTIIWPKVCNLIMIGRLF